MNYGKDCPEVYLLQGLNSFNTPEQYGGSKQTALEIFNRAVELYAEDEENTHWGLMDVYAWRGQALLALGDKDKARTDFEKALTYAPHSPWLQALLASAA
jgi:tetratricopeptide (TPR) repeat protein